MNIIKKIMVVAGGEWQVPIVSKCKELGYFVINTNLYNQSPAFKFADIYEIADVLDKEKNLEIAKKYKPDAIITDQSDIAVPTVAYICEKLGLPGIGVKTAELFTNKFLMREFCKNNGFNYPKYKLCLTIKDVYSFSNEIGFPFVIKPVNSQSSRGVYKINCYSDIEDKYIKSLKFSKYVLAEEFIPGVELTVEGFKTKNSHYPLIVSEKEHFKFNEMVASKLIYSNDNPTINYQALKFTNKSLVEKMGLPFGITHAEYKYFNGDFYLIEIAARGGGTKISSHIIPFMTSVNVNELLIKCAFGQEDIDVVQVKDIDSYIILDFFNFAKGKIKKIKNMDNLSTIENIIDYKLNFTVGDIIDEPKDDSVRHGYFIAYEKNKLKLMDLANRIKNIIELEYE